MNPGGKGQSLVRLMQFCISAFLSALSRALKPLALLQQFIQNFDVPIRVFISHSSADKDLAEALIRLLRAALRISPDSIRCTSVHGYKLPTGAEIDVQLRNEVVETETFIALLTLSSLESTYVLFELGARWGVKKPLFPVLARGVTGSTLNGPLRAINARQSNSHEEVYQFLADVAASLGIERYEPQIFQSELRTFIQLAASLAEPKAKELSQGQPSLTNSPDRGQLTISARDICTQLRAAAPLQVGEMAKGFIGYNVDWETTFSSAYPEGGNDTVVIDLNPWEPEGFDTCIRCKASLKRNPELRTLPKDAKVRLRGKILKADKFDIEIEVSEILVMPEDEIRGTRVRFLVPDVRSELGHDASETLSDKTIEDCIKAQVRMTRPEGLSLFQEKAILPEVARGSKSYKLLILYTTRQLVETGKMSNKQRQERIFRLENEIHTLENEAAFRGW